MQRLSFAMNELQDEIAEWRGGRFPAVSADTIFRKFGEEFGELARAIGNKQYSEQNLKDELVDCVVMLFGLADCFAVSLGAALLEKWALVKAGKRRGES